MLHINKLFQYARDAVCVETLENDYFWKPLEDLKATDLILATGRMCRDHWWSTKWWVDEDSIIFVE